VPRQGTGSLGKSGPYCVSDRDRVLKKGGCTGSSTPGVDPSALRDSAERGTANGPEARRRLREVPHRPEPPALMDHPTWRCRHEA
jgi:hypothetical protein